MCKYDPCDCSKKMYSGKPAPSYMLPIRYSGDDDYSRMRRSIGSRFHRQAPSTTIEDHLENIRSFAAKAGEVFANPSEAIKETSSRIAAHMQNVKEHVERMASGSDADAAKERMEKFAAALHPDKIKEHFSKLSEHADDFRKKVSKMTSNIDADSIRESISKIADPIVGHAHSMMKHSDQFFKGFQENFSAPVSRSRRSVDQPSDDGDSSYGSDESENNDERRYPMLRVKDRQVPCETIKNLQKLSKTRVELRSPESLQYVPELAMSDPVEVPKYVEYVDGEAVKYQPRKSDVNNEKSPSEQPKAGPRVVFDRYGHRYFESNGNLRLVTPHHQEAMVGAQPNFAGLADILNQNREVLHDLNPLADPTRMVPRPLELAVEGIDLIRDIARRSIEFRSKAEDAKMMRPKKYSSKSGQQKSETKVDSDSSKPEEKAAPKSIYQMFPMNIDEHEGKLLVRVYSAKDARKDGGAAEERKRSNESRPGPYVRRITKGDHDYEVITFEQSPASSAEEVQQIYKLFYSDAAKKDERKL